jgi:hypothetical protein
VVAAARRWFELDALRVEVVIGDAREVVAQLRGRFDVVMEDVFTGREATLRKPDGFPLPVLDHAKSLLAPGGVVASNTIDEGPSVRRALAARFPRVVEIAVAEHDNRIYIGGGAGLDPRRLRAEVRASALLAATLPRLKFEPPRGRRCEVRARGRGARRAQRSPRKCSTAAFSQRASAITRCAP